MRVYRIIILVIAVWISLSAVSTFAQEALTITPVPYEDLCSDYDQVEIYQQETFEDFIQMTERTSRIDNAYYFALNPVVDGEKARMLGHQTYTVPIGSSVTVEVRMYTISNPETRMRYIAFVNEKPIALAENPLKITDELTLISREMMEFTVSLPALEEGINDFSLLVIPDVDKPLNPTGSPQVHPLRLSILVGDNAIAQTQNPIYEALEPMGRKSSGEPSLILALTLDDSLKQWNYPNPTHMIQSGEPLVFNVLTGTPTNTRRGHRFALVGFVDDQPISMQEDEFVIYREVSVDTAFSRIPIQADLNLEPGLYELMMVRFNNPRIPVCVLTDETAYSNPDVMRVALEIR